MDKEISYDLLPSHNEKTLNAMKAPRTVKRITFTPSEANPGETLNVHAPKLNENEVIVPNSLPLSLTSTFLDAMPTTFLSRTSCERSWRSLL